MFHILNYHYIIEYLSIFFHFHKGIIDDNVDDDAKGVAQTQHKKKYLLGRTELK